MRVAFVAVSVVTLHIITFAAASARSTGEASPAVQKISTWRLASTSADCPYAPPSRPVEVTTPCTVVGCLLNAGAINNFLSRYDVFHGKNLETINKTAFAVPFTFSSAFTRTVPDGVTILRLHGINYRATVVLNGVVVTDANMTVGPLRMFDLLLPGSILRPVGEENAIAITVTPPLNSWSTDLAMSFLDWSPFPPDFSMGLWLPVEVVEHVPPTSDAVSTQQQQQQQEAPSLVVASGAAVGVTLSCDPALAQGGCVAFLNVSFVLESYLGTIGPSDSITVDMNCGNDPRGATLPRKLALFNVTQNCATLPPDPTIPVSLQPARSCRVVASWMTDAALVIHNPPLWWPWQMGGDPQRFRLCATHGIRTILNTTYGLREVTSTLTAGGSRQVWINGQPLLIRGGGWAPDLFMRWTAPGDDDRRDGGRHSRIWQELRLLRHAGLNAVRLEGKPQPSEFYDAADELGLLVLAGLECCTSWQQWPQWTPEMRAIAVASVRSQVRRLAHHPSVAVFLAASDELPPPDIEALYIDVFATEAWPNVVFSSASQQVSPLSGPSGVKMSGPYSFVPPNYWLADANPNVHNDSRNYGGAFGFLTEGGPGQSPMPFAAWNRTVSPVHQWDVDNDANASLSSWWSAHMGNPLGRFANLLAFTAPLNARYGVSTSARQYLMRSQAATFEAVRAYMEGYTRMKHVNATGFINWMANSPHVSHLWNLWNYYLGGGGSYYGAKKACEPLHVMMNPVDGDVSVINSLFLDRGPISVAAEAIRIVDDSGRPSRQVLWRAATTIAGGLGTDAVVPLSDIAVPLDDIRRSFTRPNATFLVKLSWSVADANGNASGANWYWISTRPDVLDWPESTGFLTPCSQYANYSDLQQIPVATLSVSTERTEDPCEVEVSIENPSPSVAFMSEIRLFDGRTGQDVAPAHFSDNYITLDAAEGATVTVVADMPRLKCSEASPFWKVTVTQYNEA